MEIFGIIKTIAKGLPDLLLLINDLPELLRDSLLISSAASIGLDFQKIRQLFADNVTGTQGF